MTDSTEWQPEVNRLWICVFTDIERNFADHKMKSFCASMYLGYPDLANRLLADEDYEIINKELKERIRMTKADKVLNTVFQ